jgi:Fe-S-cluster containining protein
MLGFEVSPMRLWFKHLARPIEPPTGEFADVLAQQEPDATPLAEAFDFVRRNASVADNIGETGDERDLYVHLDKLSDGVKASFPGSFCRAGCSQCCHYPVALFTMTYTEWRLVQRHIDTVWTEAEREALVVRYKKTFNGLWRFLLMMLQNSYAGVIMTAPLVFSRKVACPLLVDDVCTVYAARPYQCRSFGHFSARSWPGKQPKVYACSEQGENLLGMLAQAGPQLQLPVMNPLVLKIRKMCRGPRMALPLWVGIWVKRYERKKGLVPNR